MVDISFEENNLKLKPQDFMTKQNKVTFTSFLIKKGIVKNERSANMLLLIISLVMLTTGVSILIFNSGKKPFNAEYKPIKIINKYE